MTDPAPRPPRFLGMRISPITQRRLYNFRANRRGYWSFWAFIVLFGLCLSADFLANDKPLLVYYDGALLSPIAISYSETRFGGEFETEADYTDPAVQCLIKTLGNSQSHLSRS